VPELTVLMTAYNSEGTIRSSIRSILRQTLTDFELLVVDDGSRDGTAGVVSGIGDRRVRRFVDRVSARGRPRDRQAPSGAVWHSLSSVPRVPRQANSFSEQALGGREPALGGPGGGGRS